MIKKCLIIAIFLLIAKICFAWQPLNPEKIYVFSENQEYLLELNTGKLNKTINLNDMRIQ